MATASSLIIRGLQMIGEKLIGDTLTSAEETAWLAVMNAMLDSWSLERLMCYQLVQESKALTTSVGSYTIGSGGSFNTTRPTKIVDPCFVRDANDIDYPLEVIDARTYGVIWKKTLDGTYPKYLFYDAAFASSLATIYLWPEPAASLTLYINSPKQITQFTAIGTTMVLPPGYEEALSANFAIRAAAGYRAVPPEVVKIARDAKAAIKGVNLPDGILQMDYRLVNTRRWNINTG